MVRTHLDYTSSVWSPQKIKYIEMIENVQRRCTRQLPYLGRGHNMRLYLQRSLKPVRQNAFGIRIVKIWNSLPEQVVNSPNVNTFKSRLDKHWENQEILYNYRAELKITAVASEKRREDRIEFKIGNNVDEND